MQLIEFLKLDMILHPQPVMHFMLLTVSYVVITLLDQQYAGNHGSVITNPTLVNLSIAVE